MFYETLLESVLKNVDKFWLSAQIRTIMFDVIELKQENRSIGDKIKSFERSINKNALSASRFYLDGHGDMSFVYQDRVDRDKKTVKYLKKLQAINSKLIVIYRDEIKTLRDNIKKGEQYE